MPYDWQRTRRTRRKILPSSVHLDDGVGDDCYEQADQQRGRLEVDIQ